MTGDETLKKDEENRATIRAKQKLTGAGMVFNADKHHRRSIRLRHYDYSQEGAYFITICTHDRQCLFGDMTNDDMALNEPGMIVEKWWLKLKSKFPVIETDTYMIMPNHLHGIVVLVGADPRVCPDLGAHTGARRTKDRAMVQNNDDQRICSVCEEEF